MATKTHNWVKQMRTLGEGVLGEGLAIVTIRIQLDHLGPVTCVESRPVPDPSSAATWPQSGKRFSNCGTSKAPQFMDRWASADRC